MAQADRQLSDFEKRISEPMDFADPDDVWFEIVDNKIVAKEGWHRDESGRMVKASPA